MSVWIALTAVVVAAVGGTLASDETDRRHWLAAAALAVALVAAGTWWVAEPRGQVGHPVTAEAVDAAGAPVSTVLVLQREGARRQVRRAVLSQPMDGAQAALWAAIALGLLGAGLHFRRLGPAKAVAGAAVAGAAAPLVVFLGAGGSASGEAGVRAWLQGFEVGPLASFTVPDLPWSYDPPGMMPLAVGVALAAVGLVGAFAGRWAPGERLVAPAAAVAAVAVALRIIEVGGLPWRPVEGALVAVAALLAVAAFDDSSAVRRSTLVAFAGALAAVALVA